MKSPILCYHKVGPLANEGRFLNVEPELLRSHVRFLRRRYHLVCVREFAGAWPDRGAAVTFDDAYMSALTHGLQVLQQEGAVGTFYAVPALVGLTSEWDGERARPLAGWDLLRTAQSLGHEVGNHTWSHPNLAQLNWDQQVEQWTLAQDRLRQEQIIAESACYPFGSMSSRSEDAVAQAGIACAVQIGKRLANSGDSKRALPRVVVAYSDAIPKLLYKLYVRPMLP
jgi:peptidoglycan/xylan/chitin deacetylase (PgdA/CDA1 family)